MFVHELILPFYCPDCKSLAYIYKVQGKKLSYCDYNDGKWIEHPCGITNAESFSKSDYITKIAHVEWGRQSITYRSREKEKKTLSQRFTAGTILSIDHNSGERKQCSVLSLHGGVITVEIKKTEEPLSAGMLLNIEKASRTSPGKYRLQKAEQIVVKEITPWRSGEEKEQFRLIISCDDSVLLETNVKRFLSFFKENQIYPMGLIPLKIKKSQGKQIHRRQIMIPAGKDLPKILNMMTVPDSVFLEIKSHENKQGSNS